MEAEIAFYLCPTCFAASRSADPAHEHAMLACWRMAPDDVRRRPEMDRDGDLRSQAPRWFLQAVYRRAGADYRCDFYICPVCFNTSETADRCHEHVMVHCGRMTFDDARRRPLMDDAGNLRTQAPRWFLESVAAARAGRTNP